MTVLSQTGWAATLALAAGATFCLGTTGATAQERSGDRSAASSYEAGYRAGVADDRRLSSRWNDASQRESMERLERARILLREVLVTLRQSPSGERRDQALEQARQALIRTQNAMTWLPRSDGDNDRRPRRGVLLEHGWGERASGGPEG